MHMKLPIKDARVLAVLILLVGSPGISAQQLTLKRVLPNVAWPGCPAAEQPAVAVAAAKRKEADRLVEAATQAVLLGDKTEAVDLLTRALTLDPASRNTVYQRARLLDELDRQKEALAAYCRYLALAPDAPDVEEVRTRTRVLASANAFAVPAAAALAFEMGILHYQAQRLAEAEAEFSKASAAAPDWGDPLYNRAVTRLALNRTEDAASDLTRFLEMNPGSPEFRELADLLATLRGATPAKSDAKIDAKIDAQPDLKRSASGPLVAGLLVPGLGHFTTGRTGRGVLVLGVASGALMTGVLTKRIEVDCLSPRVNGECPPDQVAQRQESRPYLLPAIAVAVGTTVLGAIDAYRGANARNTRALAERRVGLNGRRRPPTLAPPSVTVGLQNTQFALLRVRF